MCVGGGGRGEGLRGGGVTDNVCGGGAHVHACVGACVRVRVCVCVRESAEH